jgi:hypothetical protein
MAYRKLGREAQARELFDGLVTYARQRIASLEGGSSLEFFAKFGSRRSPGEQMAAAYYWQQPACDLRVKPRAFAKPEPSVGAGAA